MHIGSGNLNSELDPCMFHPWMQIQDYYIHILKVYIGFMGTHSFSYICILESTQLNHIGFNSLTCKFESLDFEALLSNHNSALHILFQIWSVIRFFFFFNFISNPNTVQRFHINLESSFESIKTDLGPNQPWLHPRSNCLHSCIFIKVFFVQDYNFKS